MLCVILRLYLKVVFTLLFVAGHQVCLWIVLQSVYMHTAISDAAILVVFELVAKSADAVGDDSGTASDVGCGWGIIPLFKSSVKSVDVSDSAASPATRYISLTYSAECLCLLKLVQHGNIVLLQCFSVHHLYLSLFCTFCADLIFTMAVHEFCFFWKETLKVSVLLFFNLVKYHVCYWKIVNISPLSYFETNVEFLILHHHWRFYSFLFFIWFLGHPQVMT